MLKVGRFYSHKGQVVNYYLSLPGKIAFNLAWSLVPGDWWYKEHPGDRPFLGVEKCITKNAAMTCLFLGRLALYAGVAKQGLLDKALAKGKNT
ncbi:MAG: hypothetical protein IMW94_01950 [Thermoanaerobacter sp.]|nr:hypothetical protein [Thermoanaerobacter sp.]